MVWLGRRAWQEDENEPLILTLKAAGQEVLGIPIETFSRASGVDSRFAHYFGFPGVCWGHRATIITASMNGRISRAWCNPPKYWRS